MTSPGFCWMARPGTCGGIIGGEPCGAEWPGRGECYKGARIGSDGIE
jgi:hypothetical protein